MGRYDRLRYIQKLDPERDHQEIYRLTTGYEFPWDTVRALEIALYRTYCVPSISALLDKTGEFRLRTQKRYDDTAIIVAEMAQWGYDSERGREAQRRMNRIHSQFNISNDDYLYVLSTFIYEPIRWIDKFGWRKLSEQERLAAYYYYREVGRRMNIKNIPPSYEEFEQFNRDYERDHFRYADTNRAIGSATRNLFAAWFPGITAPLVKLGIYAMLDEPLLEAFGFPRPPGFMRTLAGTSLMLRGKFVRFLPPRQEGHFFTMGRIRTYPNGYKISDLGPPDFLFKHKSVEQTEEVSINTLDRNN